MSDLENLLWNDLTAIDRAVDIPPAPLGGVLERGYARRLRRRRVRTGAAIAGGLALVTVLSSVQWPFPGRESPDAASNLLSDVRRTEPADLAARLVKARQAGDAAIEGVPYDAWSWSDSAGESAVLMTRQVDESVNGVIRNGVLRVYLGSNLGTADARTVLTVSESNDAPSSADGKARCALDGGINFADDSTQITDANRDGVAEVTVGWWKLCVGDVSPASVNLTMITDEQVFQLSGQGVPRQVPPAERAVLPSVRDVAGQFTDANPEPKRQMWPEGTLARTDALFASLYH
jgi:hypothetical protein